MMTRSRTSIFENDENELATLDVTGFAPKAQPDVNAPPAEKVKAVSQTAKFTSREPAAVAEQPKQPMPKRQQRRHRTGRNVQLGIKASAETVEKFYAITDAHPGWVLGYTFQRAVEALERELKQSK